MAEVSARTRAVADGSIDRVWGVAELDSGPKEASKANLAKWKKAVTRYQAATGGCSKEKWRCATVLMKAPEEVRA